MDVFQVQVDSTESLKSQMSQARLSHTQVNLSLNLNLEPKWQWKTTHR